MKKLTLGFMAFALAAATLFTTSCKDDDDEEEGVASISFSGFSATAAAKTTEMTEATGSKIPLSKLLTDSQLRTTIYGLNKEKKFISVTFNGATTGSYSFGFNKPNGTQLLIDYLTNGDLKETLSDAAENTLKRECLIIYKTSSDAESAASSDFYVSTEATVTITGYNKIGSLSYVTGTFTATLQNKDKQTITISDGKFQCPGI